MGLMNPFCKIISIAVIFLLHHHQCESKECKTNADCFLLSCDEGQVNVCGDFDSDAAARTCECMTPKDYKEFVLNWCHTACKQNLVKNKCPPSTEGQCKSFDHATNDPTKTFKCVCPPKSCKTKVDCPICNGGKSDNCVNGECVCESCTGTCKDPKYKCVIGDEVPVGCPSGKCACGYQSCQKDADCGSNCPKGQRRLCDLRYGENGGGSCTRCLDSSLCTKNADCPTLKCCIIVIGEGWSKGRCIENKNFPGCDGGSSGMVHMEKCPTTERCSG